MGHPKGEKSTPNRTREKKKEYSPRYRSIKRSISACVMCVCDVCRLTCPDLTHHGFMLNRLMVLAKKLPPLSPSFFPFELDDDECTTSDLGLGGSFKLTSAPPPPLLAPPPRPPPPAPLLIPNSWLPWSVIMMLGLVVGVLAPELRFAMLVALFCREYVLLLLPLLLVFVGDGLEFEFEWSS